MLTVDACVTADGGLVVACHSGGPDWGSGPLGAGKLYKITYTGPDHPQPAFAWPAGPREVRVELDRPVDAEHLRDVLRKTDLSKLPHVQFALAKGAQDSHALVATGLGGEDVLTAYASIAGLGWKVFVEQPVSEVYATLNAAILRTVGLLVAGLLISALVAIWLARGMTFSMDEA